MKILIRSARIIDPSSSFHRKSKDILIEDGIISKIATEIEVDENVKVIEGKNLHVSSGWVDLRANFCEPGHEYKEDIKSGLMAAAYGGFTGVAISPSTHPPVDNRAAVEFLLSRKQDSPVDIFPIGTVSDKKEGKELAEMYDMHLGGAKAFSDDKQTISSNKLLYKALTYSQGFNALVMDFPMDYQWIDEGQVHEGLTSTNMGVKGIPDVAEAMMVQRDIAMLKYTGGRLHIGPISSNLSVKLIKKAKKDGLLISADVNHHSLFLTDDKLADFDSSFKLMPPLRDEKNRLALINALKDGTIDVICSDHQPEDEDEKKVEFTRSAFGAIGLESVFSIALEAIDDIELVVKKLCGGPRKVLGLERTFIEKGQKANMTVFDPKHRWVYDRDSIHSKSLNSPYIGKQMKGKSVAVINGNQYFISD
jgi:dihydroorotase